MRTSSRTKRWKVHVMMARTPVAAAPVHDQQSLRGEDHQAQEQAAQAEQGEAVAVAIRRSSRASWRVVPAGRAFMMRAAIASAPRGRDATIAACPAAGAAAG